MHVLHGSRLPALSHCSPHGTLSVDVSAQRHAYSETLETRVLRATPRVATIHSFFEFFPFRVFSPFLSFLSFCGKNMLDVCCDLTPYETSRWLELKSDRENVTRSGTARTQRQSEYIETVTMLLWSVARKCCSTRCLQSLSSTRWLRYGVGAHEARCVSRHLTRHSLSAHS